MQEIKFCQYCGEKENLDFCQSDKYQWGVTCKTCNTIGPLANSKEQAIQKWNSRIQEVPEMPQERPLIISADKYNKFGCPIQGPDKPCNGYFCMMWLWVGNDKGRCGLVNTMYINSTGYGA